MIIECINCNKKFNVNSELIPVKGRNIQCGSCNHLWFFKKETLLDFSQKDVGFVEEKETNTNHGEFKTNNVHDSIKKKRVKKDSSALVKYNKKTNYTFSNFLSLIIVIIISFIALLILIDTFKDPLYEKFPKLEFIIFNLFETFKDIHSFLKNLFFNI